MPRCPECGATHRRIYNGEDGVSFEFCLGCNATVAVHAPTEGGA